MTTRKENIQAFLKKIQESVSDRSQITPLNDLSNSLPLNEQECYYIYDFIVNGIVDHGGMDHLFGYQFEELTLDDIFDKYHPEDEELVKRVIRETVKEFIDIPVPMYTNILNVSYRFRNRDGEYKRILSSTLIFDTDDKDRVKSVLLRYTDISFMDDSELVEWTVNENYLDKDRIREEVYSPYQKIFTPREREVILEMLKDLTNQEIAQKLNISKYTVATHRKHIFRKSSCHNKNELSIFCKNRGIV